MKIVSFSLFYCELFIYRTMPKKKTESPVKTPKKQKLDPALGMPCNSESPPDEDYKRDPVFLKPKSPSKSSRRKVRFIDPTPEDSPPDVAEDLNPDIIQELDQTLEQKAKRTNLTPRIVKNMLKAVLTDSEVLKMVDYSLNKSEEKPAYELKLTRAKTKELVGLDQNAIFSIPSQPKNADIEALITQELSEDSSDEEYDPEHELSEDEESKASESFLDDELDLDSSVRSVDGVVQDENIGMRTRSKLSLSTTPLEAIEQSFVPPDITTDMYDTDCDNEEWLNFLKDFMQPLDLNQQETNDDENDPEYNVMMDEDKELTDKEELRADRAVKVTKKELNALITELSEYTDMLPSDEEKTSTKKSVVSCEVTVKKTKSPVKEEKRPTSPICQFSPTQLLLLKQQLQQHVQLLTQNCLLMCGLTDEHRDYFDECKTRLNELKNLRNINTNSYFNIINMDSCLKLIEDWTNLLFYSSSSGNLQKFIIDEQHKIIQLKQKKLRYQPDLPPDLIKLCLKSDAFLYPSLLPPKGFSSFRKKMSTYCESENMLMAIGLEEFSSALSLDVHTIEGLSEAISYVCHFLLPARDEKNALRHVKKQISSNSANFIKDFYLTKQPPPVAHLLVQHNNLKLLSKHPAELFPESWQKYL